MPTGLVEGYLKFQKGGGLKNEVELKLPEGFGVRGAKPKNFPGKRYGYFLEQHNSSYYNNMLHKPAVVGRKTQND